MGIYKRMVQQGRVVYIAKGENEGKLATIVAIIDSNKVSFQFCSFLLSVLVSSAYQIVLWLL